MDLPNLNQNNQSEPLFSVGYKEYDCPCSIRLIEIRPDQVCRGEGFYDYNKEICLHIFSVKDIILYCIAAVAAALIIAGITFFITRNLKTCQKQVSPAQQVKRELKDEEKLIHPWRIYFPKDPVSGEYLVLGQGNFGKVMSAFLLSKEQGLERQTNQEEFEKEFNIDNSTGQSNAEQIAVKIIKKEDDLHKTLLTEIASLMSINLQHEHVLGLRGIYIPDSPLRKMFGWNVPKLDNPSLELNYSKVMIILPKLDTSLDNFLKNKRQSFTTALLIDFCGQVCDGVAYIHSMQPEILHRDLATRNVLVQKLDNKMVRLKITDFGLSLRKVPKKGNDNTNNEEAPPLPLPFCAMETLLPGNNAMFTIESDYWMLAIVFWEIFSMAHHVPFRDPQQTVFSNKLGPGTFYENIVDQYTRGRRLDQPKIMPFPVYDLCLRCWSKDPKKRPTPVMLSKQLAKFLNKPEDLNNNWLQDIEYVIDDTESSNTSNPSSRKTGSVRRNLKAKIQRSDMGLLQYEYSFDEGYINNHHVDHVTKPSALVGLNTMNYIKSGMSIKVCYGTGKIKEILLTRNDTLYSGRPQAATSTLPTIRYVEPTPTKNRQVEIPMANIDVNSRIASVRNDGNINLEIGTYGSI